MFDDIIKYSLLDMQTRTKKTMVVNRKVRMDPDIRKNLRISGSKFGFIGFVELVFRSGFEISGAIYHIIRGYPDSDLD